MNRKITKRMQRAIEKIEVAIGRHTEKEWGIDITLACHISSAFYDYAILKDMKTGQAWEVHADGTIL